MYNKNEANKFASHQCDCKPGSVSDGHLSMPHISVRLKPPAITETGRLFPVMPRRRCSGWGLQGLRITPKPVSSYLAISPLPHKRGGIFSVALSLKSPSPGVTRHPCPGARTFLIALKSTPRSSVILTSLIISHFLYLCQQKKFPYKIFHL